MADSTSPFMMDAALEVTVSLPLLSVDRCSHRPPRFKGRGRGVPSLSGNSVKKYAAVFENHYSQK